jgi:hypothetical protein
VVLRDSEVAARLLALEPADQAMLAELLERVVAGPPGQSSPDDAEATR